jgi:hypothetical protein
MANLMTVPRFRAVDDDGNVMPGALLYFYVTGTTTPKAVYSDPDLDPGNALPQPVEADAGGLFPSIYYASGDYKVVLKDADEVVSWTVDPVSGSTGADTLTTRGDLLTRDASGYTRLAIGTAGYVLGSNGVDPIWQPAVVPRLAIQGLTYANGSDATNDIDIAVGGAMDATSVRMMVLESAITKRLDAAWAVGNNQGGLDTGSIADDDYYIWLINRSDTNVTDVLFSASATAPTMPANYNYKRLIGWFKRVSSAIVAFKTYETSGGGLEYAWVTPTLDIDDTGLTTARQLDAIKVPVGFSVVATINAGVENSATPAKVWIYNPDHADVAPGATSPGAAPLQNVPYNVASNDWAFQLRVRTNTSGQIAARASAAVAQYSVVTLGFEWSRR